MARPGIEVITRELTPPRSSPTDTGVWFVSGLAQRGALVPVEVTSLSAYQSKFGDRSGFATLYDAVETFFREGGGRIIVSRAVGTGAVAATKTLLDAGAAIVVTLTALGPGTWGNNLTAEVVAGSQGGTFVVIIRYNTVEVARSPDLADKDALLAWTGAQDYITITSGASANDPAVAAAAAFTGGVEGAAPTDAEYETALNRLVKDLGPGQVSFPGRTTTQAHRDLLEHALANNRVALLDAPDTATVATLQTSGQSFRAAADASIARFGAMFAPWILVPGVTSGTLRTVPPSALVAGLISRNDGAEVNQNVPSAGDLGIARWAIGISQAGWSDADRVTLNGASIDVIRDIYNSIRVYGWRTLVDSVTQASWVNFGNSRLHMTIAAEGHSVGERFVFDQLDGQGITINQFGAELTAILMPLYEAGALYGTTPEEAFFVDVGSQVNTPETIAANTLKAVLSVKMSPFGELVQIEIVKVPVTEAVV